MAIQKFSNNGASTLASSITNAVTALAVQAGDGTKFPALSGGDWFMATLEKLVSGAPVREIVKVTARATDTFTIVRAQEGTTALAFSAADKVELRITAGGMDTKMDKGGGTFTGPLVMGDNQISGVTLKDVALAYLDSTTTNTLDYVNGQHQRWAPNTGAQTLAINNWPPSGTSGILMIEGVNLGAATITTASIKWVKNDGTFTTTTSMNTNHGATLQTAGIDFIVLWTRDAGATIYGKVVR